MEKIAQKTRYLWEGKGGGGGEGIGMSVQVSYSVLFVDTELLPN